MSISESSRAPLLTLVRVMMLAVTRRARTEELWRGGVCSALD